jgi:hypothetical protein
MTSAYGSPRTTHDSRRRWGISLPLEGIPLGKQADAVREAERLGFTDIWSYEVDGLD